MDPVEASHCYY